MKPQNAMRWLILVAVLAFLGSQASLVRSARSGPMPLPCVSTTPTDSYTITPVGATIVSVNERTGVAGYWSPGRMGTWIPWAEAPAQWIGEASGDQAGTGGVLAYPVAAILSRPAR